MKLVLLPGLDGTGILFKPFIELLPTDIESQVVSYPLDMKLNYRELCDLVISQLPEHEAFILVGESFSGPIAYQIALRKPHNLKSIILVASFLSPPRLLWLKLSRFLPMGLLFFLPVPKFILRSFLLGTEADGEQTSLFRQAINKVPASILSFRLGEIVNLPKKPRHCSTRAIYIQATNDKLVPSECADELKQAVENINIFRVEGPHFIMQANPSTCVKIITNEMNQITGCLTGSNR